MRDRIRLLIAVGAAVVVVLVVVLWPRHDEPRTTTPSASEEDLAACLAAADPEQAATTCPDLAPSLAAQSRDAVDVVVLVPESDHADNDIDAITSSIKTWQGGLDMLAESDPGTGTGTVTSADLHVTVHELGPGTPYALLDPEIVILAALPKGETLDRPMDVYGVDGSVCDEIDEPFVLESWQPRPDFNSHHSLREGTFLEDCGSAGGNVCFAVNGTFDPLGDVSQVFQSYGLVNDELGHCLRVGLGASGAWGPDATQ